MSQQSSSRKDAMKFLLSNFDEWPSKETSRDHTLICGYHWCKFHPDHDWALSNPQNDTISKAEFHVAYFDDIRMEHHFDEKFVVDMMRRFESGNPKKGFNINFSRTQLRAMCHAIAEHDIAKDKLTIARRVAFKLNGVLTP